MSAPNVPAQPGYYWFKGTGRVFVESLGPDDGDEDPEITAIHGIISLSWWFSHMEPYMGGDYIDPHSLNGIWEGPLVSPFGDEEVEIPEQPTEDAVLVVAVTRSTLAVIQGMALDHEDEAQGRKVLDWLKEIDTLEPVE
jgi:hypothetical protein